MALLFQIALPPISEAVVPRSNSPGMSQLHIYCNIFSVIKIANAFSDKVYYSQPYRFHAHNVEITAARKQFSPPPPIYSILRAGAAEVRLLFPCLFRAPLPQELALPTKLPLVLPMPPSLQSIVSPYIPRPMISYLRYSLVTN